MSPKPSLCTVERLRPNRSDAAEGRDDCAAHTRAVIHRGIGIVIAGGRVVHPFVESVLDPLRPSHGKQHQQGLFHWFGPISKIALLRTRHACRQFEVRLSRSSDTTCGDCSKWSKGLRADPKGVLAPSLSALTVWVGLDEYTVHTCCNGCACHRGNQFRSSTGHATGSRLLQAVGDIHERGGKSTHLSNHACPPPGAIPCTVPRSVSQTCSLPDSNLEPTIEEGAMNWPFLMLTTLPWRPRRQEGPSDGTKTQGFEGHGNVSRHGCLLEDGHRHNADIELGLDLRQNGKRFVTDARKLAPDEIGYLVDNWLDVNGSPSLTQTRFWPPSWSSPNSRSQDRQEHAARGAFQGHGVLLAKLVTNESSSISRAARDAAIERWPSLDLARVEAKFGCLGHTCVPPPCFPKTGPRDLQCQFQAHGASTRATASRSLDECLPNLLSGHLHPGQFDLMVSIQIQL